MKTLRTVLGSSSSGSPVDHACLARRPEEGFSGVKRTCWSPFLFLLGLRLKKAMFFEIAYIHQCISVSLGWCLTSEVDICVISDGPLQASVSP